MLNESSESPTSRARQREEQRGRILAIALGEFLQHGFHGTSTRSITRKARVSSGLLFHYFPSKEAVYEELVRIGCRHLTFDAAAAIADPMGYLRDSIVDTFAMLRSHPETAQFFLFIDQAQRTPGITAEADALLAAHQIIDQTVPVFEAGQRAGVVRDGDPLALSLAFWSVLQGIAQELLVRPDLPLPQPEWILALVRADPSDEASTSSTSRKERS